MIDANVKDGEGIIEKDLPTWRTWKDFERLPFDPQNGSIYNEGPMMMMMMMREHVEFFCASYLIVCDALLFPYINTIII